MACTRSWEPDVRAYDRLVDVSRTAPDWASGIIRSEEVRDRVAMQRDAHFNSVYAALRAKGQRHGQALRSIGNRLLRILVAMLHHRTCYDASRIHREPVVQMEETM